MDEVTRAVLEYVLLEYIEDPDPTAITAATPLISSGMIDADAMAGMRRFLERKYAVRIPESEATPEAFDTAERIAALVRRLRAAVA